jgi:hypothetical protein
MNKIIRKIKAVISPNSTFAGSQDYWEQRYAEGGNSGAGSYNRLAEFKAEIINGFVKENSINTVIEFGCGDGNQLRYMNYPSYIGLDVSKTIIKSCKDKFKEDKTKSFFIYDSLHCVDNHGIFTAELSLSLDVIYHLVENEIFEAYMYQLFKSASRFVIIYSSDFEDEQVYHEKNRNFTKWVEDHIAGWRLVNTIKNKYPLDPSNPRDTSKADFFIYAKK